MEVGRKEILNILPSFVPAKRSSLFGEVTIELTPNPLIPSCCHEAPSSVVTNTPLVHELANTLLLLSVTSE